MAWLVTWEWASDHAKRDDKIAAILSPRWSPDRVRQYVEWIYVNSYYTLSERIAYAKNRNSNPYPAKFNGCQDQIYCGHNPFLFARMVDDLVAIEQTDGEEKVTWKRRPLPDFDEFRRRFDTAPRDRKLSPSRLIRPS